MTETKRSLAELIGREEIQTRIKKAIQQKRWPQVVILGGPKGIGKARLASWIGQTLLCQAKTQELPCLRCTNCLSATTLSHPDIAWYMPHPFIAAPSQDRALAQLDEWRGKELERWRGDALALRNDEGVNYYALSGQAIRREVSKNQ